MLRIGEFSKLCKLTIKMLRYYDELGLLKPVEINPDNGYRYYSVEQLRKAADISKYKDMGLSLEEISLVINRNLNSREIQNLLMIKQIEINGIIRTEQEKLAKIYDFVRNLEEGMKMERVYQKDLPEVIVASMRLVIPTYDVLYEVVPDMGRKMAKHGAVCREPAYCFNIYHDGEYKETNIDVEICEAVTEFCKDGDGVIYKKVPAVKGAVCIDHKGPYKNLGKSYSEIFEWIEKSGYRIAGDPRESFIDGCWNKEDENEWLTVIEVPVEKN